MKTDNETKHTPGEWETYQQLGHVNIYGRAVPRTKIAVVEAKTAEQKANARLIAAAPELLAACKAFVDSETNAYQLCLAAVKKAEEL